MVAQAEIQQFKLEEVVKDVELCIELLRGIKSTVEFTSAVVQVPVVSSAGQAQLFPTAFNVPPSARVLSWISLLQVIDWTNIS